MGALGALGMGMGMGLPGGIDQNALMQMFGNQQQSQRSSTPSPSTPLSRQPPAPSTTSTAPTTSSTSSSSSSSQNLAVGDLQSILSNIGVPRGSTTGLGTQENSKKRFSTMLTFH